MFAVSLLLCLRVQFPHALPMDLKQMWVLCLGSPVPLFHLPFGDRSVVMGEHFPVPNIGFSRLLVERSVTKLSEFHFLRAFLGPEQSYHFTESVCVPITGMNKFIGYFKICYYSYLQYNGHNTVYSVYAYTNTNHEI